MKIPKTVVISGRTYKIKLTNKIEGGWFSCNKKLIKIDAKVDPEELKNIFLHEVLECILTERNLRYKLNYIEPENGHYLFNFNHQQFEDFIYDLVYALKDVL